MADLGKSLEQFCRRCQTHPPCLLDVLLDPGHRFVADELQRRQNMTIHPIEPGTIQIHSKIWKKAGLRYGATPVRDSTRSSEWFNTIHYRQRDIIEYWQANNEQSTTIGGVDISQSPGRSPQTAFVEKSIVAPTLLPGSHVWLSFPDPGSGASAQEATHDRLPCERLLVPAEHFLLQGFPIFDFEDLIREHSNVIAGMAGNMFTTTVVAAIMCGILAVTPWNLQVHLLVF